ncbi:serine hydrolase domain-containing protein [Montanilutibacter psychrotolerans]|uniref:serine hydrolase domain-containing protein n=1 Tax=Montanilutibacter psychrotolerans TaxID=1327343 RepID=UPI001681C0C0|nr:serine hydrolase domain-containing protein [Lysobacter psychrotolerans]
MRAWHGLALAAVLIAPAVAATGHAGGDSAAAAVAVEGESELAARINAVIAQSHGGRFSGVVVVADGDREVYTSGHAGASEVLPNADTRFAVGSISKQFAAVLVLRDLDAGRLRLDDTLARRLPGLDAPWAGQVQLRHLLSHTSGIRDTGQPLASLPGSTFAYSNINYQLLGQVLEVLHDRPYATLAAELFARCAMADTAIGDGTDLALTGADEQPDGSLLPVAHGPGPEQAASGGAVSTARDLVRWNHCLYRGDLLSPASLALMTSAHAQRPAHRWGEVAYGYGLQLAQPGGIVEYSHGGWVQGWISSLIYYPSLQRSVVVLENRSWQGDLALALAPHDQLRDLLLAHPSAAAAPVSAAASNGVSLSDSQAR